MPRGQDDEEHADRHEPGARATWRSTFMRLRWVRKTSDIAVATTSSAIRITKVP